MVMRHLTLQTDPRYRSRDGVDDARAAPGSRKSRAKMVVVETTSEGEAMGRAAAVWHHRRWMKVRRDQLRVALVGYTNAGKSSLMQALTGSDVPVADKLFATLDTTVRALQPETTPRILVSDTVGFIKKLPHDLVASFRSTLAEALEASMLLYVVDASDPTYESQIEVSRSVLREIGAEAVPSRLLLNKIDRVSEADRAVLQEKHPNAILLSTKSPEDIAALHEPPTSAGAGTRAIDRARFG
jgi:GTPase